MKLFRRQMMSRNQRYSIDDCKCTTKTRRAAEIHFVFGCRTSGGGDINLRVAIPRQRFMRLLYGQR